MRQVWILVLFALSAPALAGENLDDPGTVVALQNRKFRLRHELDIAPGMLPLDAFYKGYTGQVSYTYHFNDFFAWQVGRASFSLNVQTNLADQLTRDFGLSASPTPQVKWIASSDFIWTPCYGKVALMNAAVLHGELFLLGGASGVGAGTQLLPAVDLGGGLRMFLTQALSVRLDVANNFVLAKQPFNVLALSLGIAVNLGGED